MSDKTDPRLVVALPLFSDNRGRPRPSFTQTVLNSLDAADRAAGVVRVDTRDEALVERLVAVIESSECVEKPEHDNTDGWGLCAICEANAILAALREES